MAMAVMTVIGLGMNGLALLPFFDSLAGDANIADRTTNIRVAVGLSTSGLTDDQNLKGNVPGLRLFDLAGNTVASAYGSSDRIAGFRDIALVANHDIGGVQGEYLSVSAGGNDAICISYISMIWPDGLKHVWIGDIGKLCGAQWYESNLEINEQHMKPYCIWIDGDGMSGSGPNGITFKGFGIHMTDFVASEDRAKDYNMDHTLMCNSKPRFHMYEQLSVDNCLPYFDPPLKYDPVTLRDVDRSKVLVDGSIRDCTPEPLPLDPVANYRHRAELKKRRDAHKPFMSGHLITSTHKGHSAQNLCSSKTSRGPDFVSYAEGFYCDMVSKQAYPLCHTGVVETCFDTNSTSLRLAKGVHARGLILPRKEYHKVENW